MMNITLQLSFRIALVWAAGFLIAVAVQALLPDQSGIDLTGKDNICYSSPSAGWVSGPVFWRH